MYFTATVNAYDVMTNVFVTATVRGLPGEGEPGSSLELHATTTLSGVGASTPRDWLEDALVGLLEVI